MTALRRRALEWLRDHGGEVAFEFQLRVMPDASTRAPARGGPGHRPGLMYLGRLRADGLVRGYTIQGETMTRWWLTPAGEALLRDQGGLV